MTQGKLQILPNTSSDLNKTKKKDQIPLKGNASDSDEKDEDTNLVLLENLTSSSCNNTSSSGEENLNTAPQTQSQQVQQPSQSQSSKQSRLGKLVSSASNAASSAAHSVSSVAGSAANVVLNRNKSSSSSATSGTGLNTNLSDSPVPAKKDSKSRAIDNSRASPFRHLQQKAANLLGGSSSNSNFGTGSNKDLNYSSYGIGPGSDEDSNHIILNPNTSTGFVSKMSAAVAFSGAPIYATALSVQRTVTSAAGVIAQLEFSDDVVLKEQAIMHLDSVVEMFWAELADLKTMEILKGLVSNENDNNFGSQNRKRAALVVSKVHYHLQEYDDSLNYALKAGDLFDLTERSEFVEKIVTICIDRYISHQIEKDQNGKGGDYLNNHGSGTPEDIDPRLLDIVERMFVRCKQDQEWLHGLGIAIECKRLDKVKDFVLSSPFLFSLIDYCQSNLRNPGIGSKNFRMKLVNLLISIYKEHGLSTKSGASSSSTSSAGGDPQQKIKFITKLLQCYVFANDVNSTKELLLDLYQAAYALSEASTSTSTESEKLKSLVIDNSDEKKNLLMVYQLCFDVIENENQQFCRDLVRVLRGERNKIVGKEKLNETPPPEGDVNETTPIAMAVEDDSSAYPTYSPQKDEEFSLLLYILSGQKKLELNLEFLFKSNRSDLLLVDKARKSFDSSKNSILHTGHLLMHGICQAGTTSDVYLRKNMDWMSKSSMWAKFSTTASLGVVHRGHIRASRDILSMYLPPEDGGGGANQGNSASFYSESGALYAMGLIHANHYEEDTENYLLKQLRQAGQSSDILRHGACLGLGLSSMGTWHSHVLEELKSALYTDNAVSGESAGYSIGLVLCGAGGATPEGADYIKELLSYAHETKHEKIIRGCSIGLAMIMFSREEGADSLIEQMMLDKDPIIRYGGCFTSPLAYCGTSSAAAINKLLHYAVSDVADDVRRAAVIGLGFVLCNSPTRVPQMVKLLSTSYNPHVRYAAAFALGISGAGMALSESEEILRPLLTDTSDFVRQGAYVSLGLIYQQSVSESAEKFRADLSTCIGNKHEDAITRFGALLAQGLIDAGGRNVCASFFSKSGSVRQGAAVGFLLFSQLWYWFPLIHGIALALNPTAVIGLNKDLKMPKSFTFVSDVTGDVKSGAAPVKKGVTQATFSYPAPSSTKEEKAEVTTTKAVLSTAAAQAKKKLGGASGSSSALGGKKTDSKGEIANSAKDSKPTTTGGDSTGKDGTKDKDKEPELPSVLRLNNPARVVPSQERYIVFTDMVPVVEKDVNVTEEDKMEVDGEEKSKETTTVPKEKKPEKLEKARYMPLLGKDRQSGFLLLTDARPEEPEILIETLKEVAEREPDPPGEFTYSIEEDEK